MGDMLRLQYNDLQYTVIVRKFVSDEDQPRWLANEPPHSWDVRIIKDTFDCFEVSFIFDELTNI